MKQKEKGKARLLNNNWLKVVVSEGPVTSSGFTLKWDILAQESVSKSGNV